MSIKVWDYSNSTETIWTTFDYGTVEAETEEEAKEKAITEIKNELKKVNEILTKHGYQSDGDRTIEMSFTDIQVTESSIPFENTY